MEYIRKSPLFKKYILSYIIVFSVPSILLLVIINSVYISNTRQELTNSNEAYLEQTNLLLEEQITEMRQLGDAINETNEFNFLAAQQEQRFRELQERIRIYQESTRSIDSLYIILHSASLVFSSRGTMSVDAMLDHSNDLNNLSDNELIYEMLINPIEQFTAENDRIFYSMPLGENGLNHGSIFFVMNTRPLYENMNSLTENQEGMSFLMDDQGDIILSSQLYSRLNNINQISDVDPSVFEREETVRINGTNYLSSSIENDLIGWKFVSLADTNRLYQPFYQIIFLVVFSVIILIAVGILISYYFAIRNYRPIRKLIEIFDKEKNISSNELDFLEDNVSKTYSEVQLLNSIMNEQAPIVQNAALLDLVKGRWRNDKVFFEHIEEQGIVFPFNYHSMIIVEVEVDTSVVDIILKVEAISRKLNKGQINENFSLYSTVPHLRNNQIFVIVNFQQNSLNVWDQVITFIQNMIAEEEITKSWTLKIAVGDTHESWKKLKNSFIEASSALEMLTDKEDKNDAILFFKDINQRSSLVESFDYLQYSKEDTILLLQSLKQGNIKTAEEVIQDLFYKMRREKITGISKQLIISSVFNSVIQAADELGLGSHSQLLLRLTNFSDADRAKKLLIEISRKICADIQSQVKTRNNRIEENVVEFLFQNYMSPRISLEQIASDNHISISYASKLIKEETGESFSTILQSLRMNLFKELLLTTTTPIKELVIEVGYYDVSNFTRKFRKENGITPGEYRRKYRKHS